MTAAKRLSGTCYCGFCKKLVEYEYEAGGRAGGNTPACGKNVNRVVFITSIEIIVEVLCPYCGEITQYKRAFANPN